MSASAIDLRDWRLQRGLTQAQAAKLLGCALRQWQYWEHGTKDIPLTQALALETLTHRYPPGEQAVS